MTLRNLSEIEIAVLEAQGNRSENWTHVHVDEAFRPEQIHDSFFSGQVTLGLLEGHVVMGSGLSLPCGIWRANVQNCGIDQGVHISDVSLLAGYDVGKGVVIQRVGQLAVIGETAFGNGTRVRVINESGGREIPIFEGMSAQIAYLIAVYRHDKHLIQKLEEMVDAFTEDRRTARGSIGPGAQIIHCGMIRDVRVGEFVVLESVQRLENGTLADCPDDPIFIGNGVTAKNFIVQSGARIDNGTILDHCFVGQGAHLDKHFTAEHSCFFANAEGIQSEVVSVFAGPFTVTHHKSTLLIAGMFSFFNAGSGTNQSNHMYKLGPLHQGVMDRGCKTGSFSYLMWPGHVGAFTTVIGKHSSHVDTADFPFSMLKEYQGRSVLSPAINLMMVGSMRDGAKWPKRDRRKGEVQDLIRDNIMSPYTAERMVQGIQHLLSIDADTPKKQEWGETAGVRIKRAKLAWAAGVYDSALKSYVGGCFLIQLEQRENSSSTAALLDDLSVHKPEGEGNWVDVAGLLAPKVSIQKLLDRVGRGEVSSMSEVHNAFKYIHKDYEALSWSWCLKFQEDRLGKPIRQFTTEDLKQIVRDWMEQSQRLLVMALKDASKEFSPQARTGYGLDGDAPVRDQDFEAVAGFFNDHSFVQDLRKQVNEITVRGEKAIQKLDDWNE